MPPIGSWTPERVEILISLWNQGLSAAKIAVMLGEPVLSRNSIISKVRRTPGIMRRLNPTAGNRPPRAKKATVPKTRAKRVTLPPLPINGPVLTADTKLLKSAAWQPLPISVPKRLADLGEIGRPATARASARLGDCRWPVGGNPTLFCACATYGIYCPTHEAMARRRVTA